ncbi:hypothetical protein Syun_023286 [Stephania yunnanensis]|uniref:Uncharacterized protein n=1 Tax=Stephania yunnanensis TaxID=152371 RepID=A0AAP0F8N8_9MAGN
MRANVYTQGTGFSHKETCWGIDCVRKLEEIRGGEGSIQILRRGKARARRYSATTSEIVEPARFAYLGYILIRSSRQLSESINLGSKTNIYQTYFGRCLHKIRSWFGDIRKGFKNFCSLSGWKNARLDEAMNIFRSALDPQNLIMFPLDSTSFRLLVKAQEWKPCGLNPTPRLCSSRVSLRALIQSPIRSLFGGIVLSFIPRLAVLDGCNDLKYENLILNILGITLIIVLCMILDLIQELSEQSDGCGYVFIGANSESLIARAGIEEVHFLSFNPTDKKTALTYLDQQGKMHRVSKGPLELVLNLASNKSDIERRVHASIDKFAGSGLNTHCKEKAIQNEYGNVNSAYGAAVKTYIKWPAFMVTSLDTGVPWVMCQQSDAPDPVIIRLIMATVGRGGHGDLRQRIRDEILLIQHPQGVVGGGAGDGGGPMVVTSSLRFLVHSPICWPPSSVDVKSMKHGDTFLRIWPAIHIVSGIDQELPEVWRYSGTVCTGSQRHHSVTHIVGQGAHRYGGVVCLDAQRHDDDVSSIPYFPYILTLWLVLVITKTIENKLQENHFKSSNDEVVAVMATVISEGGGRGETECVVEFTVKNTRNGVFICSDKIPDNLPQATCCIVGRIGDSRPNNTGE